MKIPLVTLYTLFSLYLSTPGNKTARLAQITPQSKCPLLFMARWTLFQMKESGVAQRCPRVALGRPQNIRPHLRDPSLGVLLTLNSRPDV